MTEHLPHDLESERALLCCVLTDERTYDQCSDVVCAADFYHAKCREMWEAFTALRKAGKPIDRVLVTHQLELAGIPKARDLVDRAATISPPLLANCRRYAEQIAVQARVRDMVQTAHRVYSQGIANPHKPQEYLEQSAGAIFEVTRRAVADTLVHIAVPVEASLRDLDAAMRDNRRRGTPTGFGTCDGFTGGWQAGELTILAARPMVGKSAFSLQLALNVARSHKGVVFFSLEMPTNQLVERALSQLSQVDLTKFRLAAVNPLERQRLYEIEPTLKPLPIWLDDKPGLTLLELRGKVRRMQTQCPVPLGLIVVDYIQLMRGSESQGREREVGALAQGMKELAKELSVPVLALSQLNREIEQRGSNAVPKLSDLRESGNLEQAADNIMFLHDPGDPALPGQVVWTLAKQRSGPLGTTNLRFDKRFTRFTEV